MDCGKLGFILWVLPFKLPSPCVAEATRTTANYTTHYRTWARQLKSASLSLSLALFLTLCCFSIPSNRRLRFICICLMKIQANAHTHPYTWPDERLQDGINSCALTTSSVRESQWLAKAFAALGLVRLIANLSSPSFSPLFQDMERKYDLFLTTAQEEERASGHSGGRDGNGNFSCKLPRFCNESKCKLLFVSRPKPQEPRVKDRTLTCITWTTCHTCHQTHWVSDEKLILPTLHVLKINFTTYTACICIQLLAGAFFFLFLFLSSGDVEADVRAKWAE